MGSQPRCTENTLRNTSARKKLGVEVERKENTEAMVSHTPFWWRADWIPKGKATTQATTTDASVKSTVGHSALISIGITAPLVRYE